MKKLMITFMLTAFCWTAFAADMQRQDTTGRQQDTTRKHDRKSKMPKKKKQDKRDTTNRKSGDTTTRTTKRM